MSRAYKARQIVRCPLCHVAGPPAHLGHSVMRCQACGNTYRVVMATAGNTGARLTKHIHSHNEWEKGKPGS